MRLPLRHREPANLTRTLHQRLNSYALAASAAGVGVLALAHPAEARVVYTHTDKVIEPNTQYALDLNHDGTNDFYLTHWSGSSNGSRFAGLLALGPRGNGIARSASLPYELALKKGAKISSGLTFGSAFGAFMAAVSSTTVGREHSRGNWIDVTNRYLGLRFSISGKVHFGWARLTVRASNDPAHLAATLTGYAYETIPNKPIIAGQTKGPDVVVEPATLGHLAAGASGRRRIPSRPW